MQIYRDHVIKWSYTELAFVVIEHVGPSGHVLDGDESRPDAVVLFSAKRFAACVDAIDEVLDELIFEEPTLPCGGLC